MRDLAQRLSAKGRALWPPAIGAVMIVYASVSLYPFELELPRTLDNGALWAAGQGVLLERTGVLKSKTPSALLAEAIDRRALAVSLSLKPALSEPAETARIFSSSLNLYNRNLTLVQKRDALVVRVRTTASSDYGRREAVVEGVFAAGRWVEIDVEIEGGHLKVAIDGETRWDAPLTGEPFVTWDRDYRWFIGNEGTLNRPWLGAIRRIEWRTSGLPIDILTPAYFEAPREFIFLTNFPKLVPFRDFSRRDAVENIIMYVPIGLLFGLFCLLRFGPRGAAYAIGFAFVMSLSLESAQFFISIRNTSIDDLLFNTIGGAIGAGSATVVRISVL
jgi:hypothetical protein